MIVPYFFLTRASLQHRTQKIALYALLGVGTFVIIATIMKVVIIVHEFDPPSLVFWSFIEGCVALTIACFPSLPPLIWKNTKLGTHASRNRIGTAEDSTGSLSKSANIREEPALSDDEVVVVQGHEHDGVYRTRMSTIMTDENQVFTKSHDRAESLDVERNGKRI